MSQQIRSTHVGSLPRPDALLPFFERQQAGDPIDTDAFDAAVIEATEAAVRRQHEAGIDIASHGEQGRLSFVTYVADRLSGFDGSVPAVQWADLEEFPEYARQVPTFNAWSDPETTIPAATGPVSYQGAEATRTELDRFAEAQGAVDGVFADTFVTAASPGAVTAYLGNEYYDTHEDFLFAVADAMQTEYELVAESGATLQVDAPDLLGGRHLKFKSDSRTAFLETARTHVEALNHALSTVPSDQVRMHVCWGNYEGPHHHDIPLEAVLPVLYEADIGGLLIEQANPCHQHDYRLFEEHPLPESWQLIPGVIQNQGEYLRL